MGNRLRGIALTTPGRLEEQDRVPFPTKKSQDPAAPAPKNLDPKPIRDRMMDRMRKVDPKQSERYRQRTGE
jgi:hypothetical protein